MNKEEVVDMMLKVSEIFYSIQGEGQRIGKECVAADLSKCR